MAGDRDGVVKGMGDGMGGKGMGVACRAMLEHIVQVRKANILSLFTHCICKDTDHGVVEKLAKK